MNGNRQNRQMPVPEVAKDLEVKSESLVEEVPVKKLGPINVVALRAGFYKRHRKVEGDKFTIDSEAQMGSWMKKI